MKYNHAEKIVGTQPAKINSLKPGMIIRFRYSGKNISDRNPLVLFFWNDGSEKNIHGLNLNYLTQYKITELFNSFGKTTLVSQVDKDDDDINLLGEDYTRVYLPPLTNTGTNSSSEVITEMKSMYKKRIKPVLKTTNCYRTYKLDRISSVKSIIYSLG